MFSYLPFRKLEIYLGLFLIFKLKHLPLAKNHVMEINYILQVDNIHDFELNSENIKNLDIVSTSEKTAHAIVKNQSYHINFIDSDFQNKTYTIEIDGAVHQVVINTPLDQLIKEMGLSLGSVQTDDEVYAPMPGIILEVHVKEGDSVSQGDYLCVLEAMKMENALTAPRDGIIKSANISEGDTVDKGKLLIEFETDDN